MTEEELVQGCRLKDPVCEGLLVERYAPVLMTVSRRYSRGHAEAEDVLQDAFIKIFRFIHQYDSRRGKLEAWMRSIVIRTALRDYRAKYPALVNVEQLGDAFPSNYSGIIEKLEEEDLLQLIANLPEGYRQVFNLFVLDGFSHKEISKMLGINESSSRSQLSRARALLKKQLIQFQKRSACTTTALMIALGIN